MAMLAEERRSRMLEIVQQKRFASLGELVEQLAVSESTVRRDLEVLEEIGAAKRIHGGVLYTGPSPQMPHFQSQEARQSSSKRAIAQRTAELISDGETLLLDGGSTTYEVARRLVGRRGGAPVRLGQPGRLHRRLPRRHRRDPGRLAGAADLTYQPTGAGGGGVVRAMAAAATPPAIRAARMAAGHGR